MFAPQASKLSTFHFNTTKKVMRYLLSTRTLGLKYEKGQKEPVLEHFLRSMKRFDQGVLLHDRILSETKFPCDPFQSEKKTKISVNSSSKKEIVTRPSVLKETKQLTINNVVIRNGNNGGVKKGE
eukprot:snap_masked-scaffold_3-processed-gene-17.13-mRNA-1 protein AED:1.00 eAED:1.00 QI:0/0/0/0/1/1/2/0/124